MDADDRILIETPEHVRLTLPIAGLGSRALAAIIDHSLLGIVNGAVIVLLLSGAVAILDRIRAGGEAALFLASGAVLGLFALNWGYFVVSELWMNGQTLGKRMVGLRVVKTNGQPVGFVESTLRNLIRAVDGLPGLWIAPCYGVGMISVLLSSQSRRLGDYAAGTVVIRDETPSLPQHLFLPEADLPLPADVAERIRMGLSRITPQEFDYVTYLLERAMPSDVGDPLLAQVATSLMQRMDIVPPDPLPEGFHRTFLQAIRMMYSQKSV